MEVSSLRDYAKKIENTQHNDEKLLLVIHGLIDYLSFSQAALFTYSELTHVAQGVIRVNRNGLFHIRSVYENLFSIPPIFSAIHIKKEVTYIHEPHLIRQIPAKYLDGVSRFVIIPITFGSTTIGFMTASKHPKSIDDQLLYAAKIYRETIEKALQYSNQYKENSSPLSRRETQVLQRISWGESIKEIAESLNISKHTVQGYVKSANKKLHANNRAESIAKCLRKGFIE